MRKARILAVAVLCLLLIGGTASALDITAFVLEDWGFDPSGVNPGLPGLISPVDQFTFLGTALVINESSPPGTSIPFTELGVFQATSFQNDGVVVSPSQTRLNTDYEITGVLRAEGMNTTVDNTADQNFVFTSATLDLWLDTAVDFGETTGFFGADNGTPIASFNLAEGSGNLDFAAVTPDGRVDVAFQSTFLQPGVWFDANGTDLSTLPPDLVFAITDSNNNLVAPTARQISEWAGEVGAGNAIPTAPNGDDFTRFYVQSDGSFRPAVIPEPTTLLLMGSGLLGLGLGRKKFFKKG